jgi:hypothetical protein
MADAQVPLDMTELLKRAAVVPAAPRSEGKHPPAAAEVDEAKQKKLACAFRY